MALEGAVELDGVHARDPLGEIGGENSEPGADFQNDVVARQPGEATDDAEDVLVDEKVLAEVAVRGDWQRHGSENAAAAFASMRVPSSSGSSPRTSARAATVSMTFAGSLGRPRRAWGARYGLSVSARIRSAGTWAAAVRRSFALGYVTLPANET